MQLTILAVSATKRIQCELPPTPAASDLGTKGKRSKRIHRSVAPHRVRKGLKVTSNDETASLKASRGKKAARNIKEVKEKLKVPHLNAPLSELTKEYDSVPIKDMNAWVNRPAETRKKNVMSDMVISHAP